jgi:hypothetical protein
MPGAGNKKGGASILLLDLSRDAYTILFEPIRNSTIQQTPDVH